MTRVSPPQAPLLRHVVARAPVGARGYGAGRCARCRWVVERATTWEARVFCARARNYLKKKLFHGVQEAPVRVLNRAHDNAANRMTHETKLIRHVSEKRCLALLKVGS